MDIGLLNLIENVDGEGHLAAEREGGDELGGGVGVLVEISFENLGVDLLDVAEVCAFVEVRELLLQESSSRNPTWGSN